MSNGTGGFADTDQVTDTAAVTETDVATTQAVLAGAPPGVQAQKQPAPTPAPPPRFTGKADALAYANEIVTKHLGLTSTTVYWFSSSQSHTPTPHADLDGCGFAAWTNSAMVVYLFDVTWDVLDDPALNGAEQRVQLWCWIQHESLHAKKFDAAWGGDHPPTYTAGFEHEADTYGKSGAWLARKIPHPAMKPLLSDPAAAALMAGESAAHTKNSKDMKDWLAKAPKGQAREQAVFDLFKKRGSVPKSLVNEKPADALVKTYGY